MLIRYLVLGCCFLLLSPAGPTASAQANRQPTTGNAPFADSQRAIDESLRQQRESLEKQRLAIQRQIVPLYAPAPPELIEPLPVVSQPDCPVLRSAQIDQLVTSAALKYALKPALIRAVMKEESGFKPCAVSQKGAQGLMQLMPSTAQSLRVADVFDPAQNVLGGAAYLKKMLNRYNGDLRLALAGYNAGPGRADRPTGAPYPAETNAYIAHIFAELGLGTSQEQIAATDETVSDTDTNAQPATEDSASDGELPPLGEA